MADYDFSKCMYDITVPMPKGMVAAYPELSSYEEITAAHNDNEIKISLMLTDAGSPFLKVKVLKEKLVAIFSYLDIPLKNAKNKLLFDSVLNYDNDRVFAMCGLFLQMQNNHEFTYWWNTNQLYYSLMTEMGKPRVKLQDGSQEEITRYVDRKLKIQKQADPIKNDLLKIEAEIFSDSKMKMAIAKSKLRLTRTYPEMHADENSVF